MSAKGLQTSVCEVPTMLPGRRSECIADGRRRRRASRPGSRTGYGPPQLARRVAGVRAVELAVARAHADVEGAASRDAAVEVAAGSSSVHAWCVADPARLAEARLVRRVVDRPFAEALGLGGAAAGAAFEDASRTAAVAVDRVAVVASLAARREGDAVPAAEPVSVTHIGAAAVAVVRRCRRRSSRRRRRCRRRSGRARNCSGRRPESCRCCRRRRRRSSQKVSSVPSPQVDDPAQSDTTS